MSVKLIPDEDQENLDKLDEVLGEIHDCIKRLMEAQEAGNELRIKIIESILRGV